jgi:methionine-rich copper-binding protein CopC
MVVFTVLFFASVASAHVSILKYEPAPDAVLEELPEEVVLTMAGSAEPLFSKIEVFDEDNVKVSGKKIFLKYNTVMKVYLRGNLASGTYTVKWLCIGLDGHKKSGRYTFSIEESTGTGLTIDTPHPSFPDRPGM